MAIDPDLELQGLVVNALKADAAVTALVGGRVYDRVPDTAAFPYIVYGPSDATSEDADCYTDFDVFAQLDVWSRYPGKTEAKKIADAVRVALANPALQLTENALVLLRHQQTRTFTDPDGLTTHGAMTFEALIERR